MARYYVDNGRRRYFKTEAAAVAYAGDVFARSGVVLGVELEAPAAELEAPAPNHKIDAAGLVREFGPETAAGIVGLRMVFDAIERGLELERAKRGRK